MRTKSIRPIYKDDILKQEVNETINKMLQIQDILLNYGNINKNTNYMIEYFNILQTIENENANYSMDFIKGQVNKLYDKIFKKRRY